MEDGIKEISVEMSERDKKLKDDELSSKIAKTTRQKILFWSVLVSSGAIMVFSLCVAYNELVGTPKTQEVAIIGFMLTIPVILMLSLMRYVYDGKKSDEPQPTLLLNVGKEFVGMIKTVAETIKKP